MELTEKERKVSAEISVAKTVRPHSCDYFLN